MSVPCWLVNMLVVVSIPNCFNELLLFIISVPVCVWDRRFKVPHYSVVVEISHHKGVRGSSYFCTVSESCM